MEAQLYNATKKPYRLYRTQQLSTFVSPKMLGVYTVRNNSQHLLARKCWESLDSVGDDVQTDATTLNRDGT